MNAAEIIGPARTGMSRTNYFEDIEPIFAKELVKDVGSIFEPPRRIRVSNAVEENVVIATPGGFSGNWAGSQTPYMVEPMDMLSSRQHTTVIFVGPARTGKTQGLIDGGIGYVMSSDPSDVLVVHMTEEAARKYSKLRVGRMIDNSPNLRKMLSASSNDNNLLQKLFRNGTALMIGYPSPTQLSAQDYKYVFVSDYDRMPDDNGEGEIYPQALKRTQTFMSGGMCVVESSPGRDFLDVNWRPSSPFEAPPVGGILGLYNTGDKRIWHWNCPDCSDEFPLIPGLDLFNLPQYEELIDQILVTSPKKAAIELADIACPKCGCILEHRHKNEMNLNGLWLPETCNPSSVASFWLSGTAAKFQTWESLLEKEFLALKHFHQTGEEEKLKATRNTDQGIPYIPFAAAESMTAEDLMARAEDLPKRKVPHGVKFLIASVDVQANKFVVQVQGFGRFLESWIVDRFDIVLSDRDRHGEKALLDPAAFKEDWDVLIDQVINKRYELDDDSGREMGIIKTVCDSGGKEGVTENAYQFWKRCKDIGLQKKFDLLKGERPDRKANKPMIYKTLLDKSSKAARKANVGGKLNLFLVNTTIVKDAVNANLKRTSPGKDYIHFPSWLQEFFYKELVAEIRTEKGWENKSRSRNESFDLLCYAKSAYLILMDDYWRSDINWDSPPAWAEKWDNNSEVSDINKFETAAKQSNAVVHRRPRMRMKR